MKLLLLARAGSLGVAMMLAALAGAGRLAVLALEGAAADPTSTYVQGGVAVAAIGFAGAVVKFMSSQNDKVRQDTAIERQRGDRLEAAALTSVAANAASSAAMDKVGTAMTEMGRRLDELVRGK